jgi:hypothetical protein
MELSAELPEETFIIESDRKINVSTGPSNSAREGENQNLLDLNVFAETKRKAAPEMIQTNDPSSVPMSPGKKLLYYAGSPGRYIKA